MPGGYAKASPQVDEAQPDPEVGDAGGEVGHHRGRPGKGLHVEDLRPDVAVDPDGPDMVAAEGRPVRGQDVPGRKAELRRPEAGCDLRVGGHLEGGIHPEGNLRGFPGLARDPFAGAELVQGLDRDPDSPQEQALYRREKIRIDDMPDRGGARALLCHHVKSLELSYWDWSKQEWASEWSTAPGQRPLLPTRVRVKLVLRMPDGRDQPFETQARIAIVRPLDF